MKNKLVERSASMFHTERLQIRKYTMDDLQFYASLWGTRGNALYWKWDIKTYMQCKKSGGMGDS